jgi:hypothetical protein
MTMGPLARISDGPLHEEAEAFDGDTCLPDSFPYVELRLATSPIVISLT